MAKVTNLNAVASALKRLKNREGPKKRQAVTVGFTQTYALFVHEDLEARHEPGKTAKYLEGPSRRFEGRIADIIRETFQKTSKMDQALLLGGLFLQRKAQEIVPIDTGALRASAFTAPEEREHQAAEEAFQRSEQLRLAELRRRKLTGEGGRRRR